MLHCYQVSKFKFENQRTEKLKSTKTKLKQDVT